MRFFLGFFLGAFFFLVFDLYAIPGRTFLILLILHWRFLTERFPLLTNDMSSPAQASASSSQFHLFLDATLVKYRPQVPQSSNTLWLCAMPDRPTWPIS